MSGGGSAPIDVQQGQARLHVGSRLGSVDWRHPQEEDESACTPNFNFGSHLGMVSPGGIGTGIGIGIGIGAG